MEQQPPRRFSDFARQRALEGDKATITDILNQEIVAHAFQKGKSKLQNCETYVKLQFSFAGSEEKLVVFTASQVLAAQLEEYRDYLPFATTVRRVKNYYTFT